MAGKRVAVIGSGASAIQFVPHIAQQVSQLTLFQRTAPWVLAKLDAPIAPLWQALFAKHPWTQSLFRTALYLQFELLNAKGLDFQHPGGELDPDLTCSDCHNGGIQK